MVAGEENIILSIPYVDVFDLSFGSFCCDVPVCLSGKFPGRLFQLGPFTDAMPTAEQRRNELQ